MLGLILNAATSSCSPRHQSVCWAVNTASSWQPLTAPAIELHPLPGERRKSSGRERYTSWRAGLRW